MATEMQGRRRLSRGGRRPALLLYTARPVTMEIGEDNECDRAAERGVPPLDQNLDRATLRQNRANAALGLDGPRPDPDAQGRWLGKHRSAHGTDHP